MGVGLPDPALLRPARRKTGRPGRAGDGRIPWRTGRRRPQSARHGHALRPQLGCRGRLQIPAFRSVLLPRHRLCDRTWPGPRRSRRAGHAQDSARLSAERGPTARIGSATQVSPGRSRISSSASGLRSASRCPSWPNRRRSAATTSPILRPSARTRSLIIGMETRPLQPGASGGIVQNQIGVFRDVFACYPEHRYVIFCTAANRALFAGLSDGVQFVELPGETYSGALGAWLAQHRVDVLFRSYPDPEPLDFPLARQIVYVPDNQHDFLPELFEPPVLDYRRRAFGQVLAGAGAIGTISEFARRIGGTGTGRARHLSHEPRPSAGAYCARAHEPRPGRDRNAAANAVLLLSGQSLAAQEPPASGVHTRCDHRLRLGPDRPSGRLAGDRNEVSRSRYPSSGLCQPKTVWPAVPGRDGAGLLLAIRGVRHSAAGGVPRRDARPVQQCRKPAGGRRRCRPDGRSDGCRGDGGGNAAHRHGCRAAPRTGPPAVASVLRLYSWRHSAENFMAACIRVAHARRSGVRGKACGRPSAEGHRRPAAVSDTGR